MLTPVYQGRADVRYHCDVAMTAGKLVSFGAADHIVVSAGAVDTVIGFAAETNKNWADDYSEHVSLDKKVANYGDKIGVYRGGSFKTDQFLDGTLAPGTALYCTTAGLLTETYNSTVSSSAGKVKCGYVVKKHSATLLEFESCL